MIGSAEKDSLSDVEELDDTVDSEDDPIYDDTSDSDIDSSAFIDERRRPLKQRGDFVTEKEYSDYIKDTVRLGMIVQFQRSLNGSVYTDVGKVTKVSQYIILFQRDTVRTRHQETRLLKSGVPVS